MGSLFTKQHFQTQYDKCDICKTNRITYKSCFVVPKHFNQGSLYFTCTNGHHFFVNTFGDSYETINERFKCTKM